MGAADHMVVNGRPPKRPKRQRVTADLCDFLTFPEEDAADDWVLDGPFRSNIWAFLARHGRLPAPPSAHVPHLLTWRVKFRIGGGRRACAGQKEEEMSPQVKAVAEAGLATVDLFVVEEDVPRSKSIYCDQCRVVGWSGHPVCGKRYHFIIKSENLSSIYGHQTCVHCGTLISVTDSRCSSCNYETIGHEIENWVFTHLEDSTHLLHGVIHINGYGHLLRVNGREGGSKHLSGHDIMSFWDRLCKLLQVRKVSVMDISRKYGMEYRLLHAVTAGCPWYGTWGYRFGAGSFALTAEAYQKAVETLSAVPLSVFFSHSRLPYGTLQNTISFYLSICDYRLLTVRDLFCYVSQLLHEAHGCINPTKKKRVEAISKPVCIWSSDDIQAAEVLLVKVLRAVGSSQWVAWRSLKGAISHAIKPPELVRFCLSGLAGKLVDGSMVIAARFNTEKKAIEYRLEAAPGEVSSTQFSFRPSKEQLLDDLKFLYDALLNPATMEQYKPIATRASALSSATKLLDCKQFIKNYDESLTNYLPHNPFTILIWCHVELLDHGEDYTAPPPELLVIPTGATIADIKLEATRAYQETYVLFQRFKVEHLVGYEAEDATLVKHLFTTGATVRVRGRCISDDCSLWQFRKERGLDNWIVDCYCGARDDDGERMMACDACGIWHHTRCAGVDDLDEVPARFICQKCVLLNYRRRGAIRKSKEAKSGVRCKDEIKSSLNAAGRLSRLAVG